jgi:thiamine pyrophosphate-dependent acetolactate synthase large subunit-like protein
VSEPLPREAPIGVEGSEPGWGSDVVAEVLREVGLKYIALNPGSSYRGLHDSLVNHAGNHAPQMLLCLHEEHAVSIAHGYAKVTDRPMGVALHSNVGLLHGSMALFNAFCDRVPMLVIGATGPLDAARRRPWIDWLHTATDQAALVRPFLKWDDQPISVPAAVDAVLQAHRLTSSAPKAPTYVCLDTSLQEASVDGFQVDESRRPGRFGPAAPPAPDETAIAELVRALGDADDVVLLVGRTTRDPQAWRRRVELAELLGCSVFTHLKLPAAFPTCHPLHSAPPETHASPELRVALQQADVVISLDWLDLGGTLDAARPVDGLIVSATLDEQLHGGWGKESLAPAPTDVQLHADPDATVAALLRHLGSADGPPRRAAKPGPAPAIAPSNTHGNGAEVPSIEDLAAALNRCLAGVPSCLVRVPISWTGALWDVADPLDTLGGDGGEGVGSGPGMTVGAALALRDADRLALSVLGDGDFLMGANALWTAAHYELPLLIVVANNQSFFNDEVHQHQVARLRGRPMENRWIGQRITDPAVDLCGIATAQGLTAHGPVTARRDLEDTLGRAVDDARRGASVVVDVHVASTIDGESRFASQATRG